LREPFGIAAIPAPARGDDRPGVGAPSESAARVLVSIGSGDAQGKHLSAVWLRRLGLVVAAFVLQTALLEAALPNPDEAPGDEAPARSSLAGQLLVAAPSMGDPRFDGAVILVVQQDSTGALGIVINKPIGERSLAGLFEDLGRKGDDAQGSVRLFSGGPMQPELGFVVHSADYHRPETVAVTGRLSLTASVDVLRDIGKGKGPAKFLVAFGYAGWGAGQLDREIELGAWATAEADPTVVFDADRQKLWDETWKHRTQHL
jgi:putative transcriptional regulator